MCHITQLYNIHCISSHTLYRLLWQDFCSCCCVFCCNCKMDMSLQSLITPLQHEHIGFLAVANATFPNMSAPRHLQDALSRLPQPLIVPENFLRSILAAVRQRAPQTQIRGRFLHDQSWLSIRLSNVVPVVVQAFIRKSFASARHSLSSMGLCLSFSGVPLLL